LRLLVSSGKQRELLDNFPIRLKWQVASIAGHLRSPIATEDCSRAYTTRMKRARHKADRRKSANSLRGRTKIGPMLVVGCGQEAFLFLRIHR
jgi:hypothetical protein